MASNANKALKVDKKYLIIVLFFVLAMYVVVPQLRAFKSSWHLLAKPDPFWLSIALITCAGTYLAGSLTYVLLAFKRLKYLQTLLVQLAAMFINRLLPAGVGALGANYLFLRHTRHTPIQAGSVVAINNLLGFVGHSLIVGLTLYFAPSSIKLSKSGGSIDNIITIAVVILIGLIIGGAIFGRKRLNKTLKDLSRQLSSYRKRPLRLVGALGSSMLLTTANILCLMACAQAVGIGLSLSQLVIIFSFGIGLGTATPTPGGLGGFEAGLVAGFVAYGISSPTALAAALLYRLVSYWLPLVVGSIAFVACQQRSLFLPAK